MFSVAVSPTPFETFERSPLGEILCPRPYCDDPIFLRVTQTHSLDHLKSGHESQVWRVECWGDHALLTSAEYYARARSVYDRIEASLPDGALTAEQENEWAKAWWDAGELALAGDEENYDQPFPHAHVVDVLLRENAQCESDPGALPAADMILPPEAESAPAGLPVVPDESDDATLPIETLEVLP